MWHQARQQERTVHSMLVDHRKRAERRRQYYEKILQDPNQFLQVHGRPCRVYLEPAQGVSDGLMPLPTDRSVLIDRFDGRAHLDYIGERESGAECVSSDGAGGRVTAADDLVGLDQHQVDQIQYERYRILVQNRFLGLVEHRFLQQMRLEEQLGGAAQQQQEQQAASDKRRLAESKAAIGYNYEQNCGVAATGCQAGNGKSRADDGRSRTGGANDGGGNDDDDGCDDDDDDDEDVDLDLSLDVERLSTAQYTQLNNVARSLGFSDTGFMDLLMHDREELDAFRLARLQEEEKQAIAGKKCRKERRQLKEQQMLEQLAHQPRWSASSVLPSYAVPHEEPQFQRTSRSRSASPVVSNSVQYITSFGQADSDSDLDQSGGGPNITASAVSKQSVGPPRESSPGSHRQSSSSAHKYSAGHSPGSPRSPSSRRSRLSSGGDQRRRESTNSGGGERSNTGSYRVEHRYSRRSGNDGRFSHGESRRSDSRYRRSRSRSRRSRSRSRWSRSGNRRSRSRNRRSRSRNRRSRSHESRRRSSVGSGGQRSVARDSLNLTNDRDRRKGRTAHENGTTHTERNGPKPALSEKNVSQTGGSVSDAKTCGDEVAANQSRAPSPPVRRYYGRRRSSSSSSLGLSSDGETTKSGPVSASAASVTGSVSTHETTTSTVSSVDTQSPAAATVAGAKITPQERMRLKMAAALRKNQRAEHRNQLTRQQEQERQLYQRQAELRAARWRHRRRSSSSGGRSPSSSDGSGGERRSRRRRRRSDRSNSSGSGDGGNRSERRRRYRRGDRSGRRCSGIGREGSWDRDDVLLSASTSATGEDAGSVVESISMSHSSVPPPTSCLPPPGLPPPPSHPPPVCHSSWTPLSIPPPPLPGRRESRGRPHSTKKLVDY